ncbi:Hypothetical predicted protein [Pelobates cultripes]|uniref:Uncharacterized protein n=1 Tax=Pelobates cultripes TaxID=61616 RepID=A0AAD1VNM1_PELCU|nr:Hypothetical predicted protein [Pelobates cultripes]
MAELEERVEMVVTAHNHLADYTLELQHRIAELEFTVEDLPNRSHQNYLRLQAIPEGAGDGDLKSWLLAFCALCPPTYMTTYGRSIESTESDSTDGRKVSFGRWGCWGPQNGVSLTVFS